MSHATEAEEITEKLEAAMKDKLLVPPEPVKAPVTGKPRREFKWGKLDESWREAFIKPLKDAIDVYTDNQAVEAVPMGMMVPPDSILPSRLVLTNKSEAKEIAKAKLKARWVLAGHLDKEAGKYATEAPASEILVLLLSDKNIWTRSILVGGKVPIDVHRLRCSPLHITLTS